MVESSTLQKYSLFGGLLEDQIEQIIPLMEVEKYGVGDIIMTEGELNDRIRFILSGRVEVYKSDVHLTEFREGDFFGEMEVLDVCPPRRPSGPLFPWSLCPFPINRSGKFTGPT
jgi:CRP-like cAMP-binding protein